MGQISELQEKAYKTSVNHGFHNILDVKPIEHFGIEIALCHSELSEVMEEYRKGHYPNVTYEGENGEPMGIPFELADTVIRIFDICGEWGINLENMILEKMEYNKERPYLHGGKKER